MNNLLFLNIGSVELIILLIFAIIPLGLLIYALIDLMKRDFSNKQTEQILLFILVIFASVIGPIIYLAALRKNYPIKRRATN